jgi:hypothetical protein
VNGSAYYRDPTGEGLEHEGQTDLGGNLAGGT